MNFWVIAAVLVLGGLEWIAVENFLDNVQEMLDKDDVEAAMAHIQTWHWLIQLDPLFHTYIHELQQQIFLSQHQEAFEEMMEE